MRTNVAEALSQCTSIKKIDAVKPNTTIHLLATLLCLMLLELKEMAKDLFRLLPAGLPQRGAQKISCDRLKQAEIKAKKQFKNFVSSLITDSKERKKVIAAFNADVANLI